MLYLDYEDAKESYKKALGDYEAILAEKEALFRKTQPRAVQFDKEKVKGGKPSNPFESYLVQKEKRRIDERLDEAKKILNERLRLLNEAGKALYESRELEDKVYRMRYVERFRVRRIAKNLNYSEAQVFRILKKIQSELKR